MIFPISALIYAAGIGLKTLNNANLGLNCFEWFCQRILRKYWGWPYGSSLVSQIWNFSQIFLKNRSIWESNTISDFKYSGGKVSSFLDDTKWSWKIKIPLGILRLSSAWIDMQTAVALFFGKRNAHPRRSQQNSFGCNYQYLMFNIQ